MHTQELKKKLTRVSRELHPNGSNSHNCANQAREAVLSFLQGKVDHDTLTLARSLLSA